MELGEPRGPGRPPHKVKNNPLANAPSEPCSRCGVRADVGCRHRPAAGPPPPAMDPRGKPKKDGRHKSGSGWQGRAFHPVTRSETEALKALFTKPGRE